MVNVTITESGLLRLKTLASLMKNKETDLLFIEAKEDKLYAYYYAQIDGMALKVPVDGLVHSPGLVAGDKKLIDIIINAGREQVVIKENEKTYSIKGRHQYRTTKHEFALESFSNIKDILNLEDAKEIGSFDPNFIPKLAKIISLAHQYADKNAASKFHGILLAGLNGNFLVCGGNPNYFFYYKTNYKGEGKVVIPYDEVTTTVKVLTNFAPTTIKANDRSFFLVDEDFIFAAPQSALEYPEVEDTIERTSHKDIYSIEITATKNAFTEIGDAIKPTIKYDTQMPIRLFGEEITYDAGEPQSEIEVIVKREFIEDSEEIDFSSKLEYDLIDPKAPFVSRVIPFEPVYRFAKFFKRDVVLSLFLQNAASLAPFNMAKYTNGEEELVVLLASIKAPTDNKYLEGDNEGEANNNNGSSNNSDTNDSNNTNYASNNVTT